MRAVDRTVSGSEPSTLRAAQGPLVHVEGSQRPQADRGNGDRRHDEADVEHPACAPRQQTCAASKVPDRKCPQHQDGHLVRRRRARSVAALEPRRRLLVQGRRRRQHRGSHQVGRSPEVRRAQRIPEAAVGAGGLHVTGVDRQRRGDRLDGWPGLRGSSCADERGQSLAGSLEVRGVTAAKGGRLQPGLEVRSRRGRHPRRPRRRTDPRRRSVRSWPGLPRISPLNADGAWRSRPPLPTRRCTVRSRWRRHAARWASSARAAERQRVARSPFPLFRSPAARCHLRAPTAPPLPPLTPVEH